MPTITFSGLASGLDTASWVDALVSVKQLTVTSLQSKLQTVQTKQSNVSALQTAFTSLRSSVEKITDSKFGGSMDLFASNSATSSDEDIFTATATKGAARQSYEISVKQLATVTSVASDKPVSAVADDNTKLSSLGIEEGSFTVYVDGVKNVINISENDTVQDLKSRLSAAGVKAEIDNDGCLNLSTVDENDKLLIGATNDTSNIKSLLGLSKQDDGSYKSTISMYKVSTATKLTEEGIFSSGEVDAEGNPVNKTITTGTFVIGDATFTIDENTTMSNIISQINSSTEANVNAYWDSTASKLVLTSKITGQSFVNIEAGTSNFTDVMGFTESTWDENGDLVTSALKTDNQTLGQNAIAYINGTQVISSSNTITSDISRIEGVTISLKSTTPEDATTSTLTVEQDTSALEEALNNIVEQYNSVMTTLDTLTTTGGSLYGDTTINNIKRSLRQLITTSTGKSDDTYTMLAQVGLTTASVGAELSDDTSSLSLDTSALKKALAEDPDAVKKVLMGTSSDQYGLLSQIENVLDNSLSSTGFFVTTNTTLESEIDKYNDKITTATERIATYKSNLEAKFEAMEQTISSMQSAYSDLLSSSSSSSSS